jgi:hypothetical protein
VIDEEQEPALFGVEHHARVRSTPANDSDLGVVLYDNHIAVPGDDVISGRRLRCGSLRAHRRRRCDHQQCDQQQQRCVSSSVHLHPSAEY